MGPANAGVAKRLGYGRGEMTGLTPALSRAIPPSQIKSGGPQGAGEDTGWGEMQRWLRVSRTMGGNRMQANLHLFRVLLRYD